MNTLGLAADYRQEINPKLPIDGTNQNVYPLYGESNTDADEDFETFRKMDEIWQKTTSKHLLSSYQQRIFKANISLFFAIYASAAKLVLWRIDKTKTRKVNVSGENQLYPVSKFRLKHYMGYLKINLCS